MHMPDTNGNNNCDHALAASRDTEWIEDMLSLANLPPKVPIFGLPSTELQAETPAHNAWFTPFTPISDLPQRIY